jgi:hypothetical protein
MSEVRILETLVRLPPLGMRCVDISTNAPVTTGLHATATPFGARGKTVTAFTTRSGVLAWQGLPGLHDFEFGEIEDAILSPSVVSPPATKEFAILVEDLQSRYLPWGVALRLPRADVFRALLFPAPSRPAVPGLAVIRGSLKDAERYQQDGTPRPAAYARIEAQYETAGAPTVYVGLADWRGQFALFLPFPNPLQPPSGVILASPNTTGRKTIAELRWPVTLSFFYEPDGQKFICTRANGQVELITVQLDVVTDSPLQAGGRCVPDLPSLLTQAAALVASPAAGPPATTLQAEIEFGKETVLRAAGGDADVWLQPI